MNPLENFNVLIVHKKRPSHYNNLNLHDVIPEGARQLRFTKNN